MANVGSREPEGLVKRVKPREPLRLVNMVKPCPRPLCGSTNTTWRYYNNGKRSQPRYLCNRCDRTFTFGGKIQISQEEQTAMREQMTKEKATKVLKNALKPGNLTAEQRAARKATRKRLAAKKAAKKKLAAKKAAQKEEERTSNLQEICGDDVHEPEVKPKYKSVRFDL